jgi:thiol-disulfide isomerase/thioredoxin
MIFSFSKTVAVCAAVLFTIFVPTLVRAQTTNGVGDQIHAVIEKIQANVEAGKKTESDSAKELKTFDEILAQLKGAKTEDAAQVVYVKAMVLAQLFGDFDKATDLIKKLKSDYPDTHPGQDADKILEQITQQAAAKKIQDGLTAGQPFPGFSETDLDGKPLATADFKGKILLIDFWATWCPPCRAELPNVIAVYKKYHTQGFEIIGVSLDDDKDKLTSFIKEQGMTWQQFFDGQGWKNKVAVKFGVDSIPFTILVDGDGKIIGTNLRGEDLETAVAKAVKK